MGIWFRKNGQTAKGLLEWTTAAPETFTIYLASVKERIPTDGNRTEEVHIFKIDSLFKEGP